MELTVLLKVWDSNPQKHLDFHCCVKQLALQRHERRTRTVAEKNKIFWRRSGDSFHFCLYFIFLNKMGLLVLKDFSFLVYLIFIFFLYASGGSCRDGLKWFYGTVSNSVGTGAFFSNPIPSILTNNLSEVSFIIFLEQLENLLESQEKTILSFGGKDRRAFKKLSCSSTKATHIVHVCSLYGLPENSSQQM